MPKTTHRLSAVSVTNSSKPGLHADGAGLYLKVSPTGARSWVFRFMRDGKPRYLGLGSANTVTLAMARGSAAQARQQLQSGLDPIEARKQAIIAARAAAAKSVPFKEFSESVIDAQEAGMSPTRQCLLFPRKVPYRPLVFLSACQGMDGQSADL